VAVAVSATGERAAAPRFAALTWTPGMSAVEAFAHIELLWARQVPDDLEPLAGEGSALHTKHGVYVQHVGMGSTIIGSPVRTG
jgi:hypothetical protein